MKSWNNCNTVYDAVRISCGPGVLNGLKTAGGGVMSCSVEQFHFSLGVLGDTVGKDLVFLLLCLPLPFTGRFRSKTASADLEESKSLHLFSAGWLVLGCHSSSEDST